MISWIIPIVRQSKTDLFHRQVMRPLRIPIVRQSKTDLFHRQVMSPLRHNLQNGYLHDVRDASLVCGISQFLTAWRLVLSMKPWSYIWLEFGLFSTIIYIYVYLYIGLNKGRCIHTISKEDHITDKDDSWQFWQLVIVPCWIFPNQVIDGTSRPAPILLLFCTGHGR